MTGRAAMNMARLQGAVADGVMPAVAVIGDGVAAQVSIGIGDEPLFAFSPGGARKVAVIWREHMGGTPAAGVPELLEIAADVCQARREAAR